jgi:predicted nucleotidyltransferase
LFGWLRPPYERYAGSRQQRGNIKGPWEALRANYAAVRAVIAAHRALNARVFGSAAHGSDSDESDLDILIDPTAETTLFDIGGLRHEVRLLLRVRVDVVTPNALPGKLRDALLAEAVPI